MSGNQQPGGGFLFNEAPVPVIGLTTYLGQRQRGTNSCWAAIGASLARIAKPLEDIRQCDIVDAKGHHPPGGAPPGSVCGNRNGPNPRSPACACFRGLGAANLNSDVDVEGALPDAFAYAGADDPASPPIEMDSQPAPSTWPPGKPVVLGGVTIKKPWSKTEVRAMLQQKRAVGLRIDRSGDGGQSGYHFFLIFACALDPDRDLFWVDDPNDPTTQTIPRPFGQIISRTFIDGTPATKLMTRSFP